MTYKHGPEELEMFAFFDYVRLLELQDPRLKLCFHCPNERKSSIQRRMSMNKAGVRKGIPDIIFPVPNQRYSGLFIEMKVKPNRASVEQMAILKHLNELGAFAILCWSATEAINILDKYLQNQL